jgi:hypothetical protein
MRFRRAVLVALLSLLARFRRWRGDPAIYWKRDGSYIERDDK